MEKLAVIRKEDVEMHEALGGGGFGIVYRGKHKVWGDVAVKVLKSIIDKDVIRKEANKMKKTITSEYFVRIKGLIETEQTTSIVMEYFELGSLKSFRRYLDAECWPRMIRMILEISMGMNYLHTLDPPTLHRDLKADNIFVGEGFQIKIGDFGLALDISSISSSDNKDTSGTCTHIPPELWSGTILKPTMKMDIYGFSITMFEFVSGKVPWPHISWALAHLVSQWVVQGKRPELKELPPETPDIIITLMEMCWAQNPDERPTFQEIQELLTALYESDYRKEIRKADIVINRNMIEAGKNDSQDGFSSEESGLGTSTSIKVGTSQSSDWSSMSSGSSAGAAKSTLSSSGSNTKSASSEVHQHEKLSSKYDSRVTGQIVSNYRTRDTRNSLKKHVMISYQWDAQERMLKLRDALLSAGFDVWMDVDRMEGNMNERMAEAVEGAAAILVCFSKKYQESRNAMKELGYANHRGIKLIPLRYEDYNPSGSLGFIINTLLYYDIKTDEDMMKNMPNIIKVLRKCVDPRHSASQGKDPIPTPQHRSERTTAVQDDEKVDSNVISRRNKSEQSLYQNVEIGKPRPERSTRSRPPAPPPEPVRLPPVPPPKQKSAQSEELYENLGETEGTRVPPEPLTRSPQSMPNPQQQPNNQPGVFHGGARPRQLISPISPGYTYTPQQVPQPKPGAIDQLRGIQSGGVENMLRRDLQNFLSPGSQTVHHTAPTIPQDTMDTGFQPQAATVFPVTPGQGYIPPATVTCTSTSVPQMVLQKEIQLQHNIKAVHCFSRFIAICTENYVAVYDMERIGVTQPEYTLASPDWNSFPGDVTATDVSILAVVFGDPNIYVFDKMHSSREKTKVKISKQADPRAIQAGHGKVIVVTNGLKLRIFLLPDFKLKSMYSISSPPSTIHLNQCSLLVATTNIILRYPIDNMGKKITIYTSDLGLGNCKGAMLRIQSHDPKILDPFYVLSEAQFRGTIHCFAWNRKKKQFVNAGCIAKNIPAMIWKGMHISETGQVVVACEPNRLQIYRPYQYLLQVSA
ncbi:uncharacterized protein [Amphiura filiformis]|uniref:uncharacterized protein isoform X2 n=1 Tax=Amphiura filiformis TaxID=82378 RepID=UPI003B217C98